MSIAALPPWRWRRHMISKTIAARPQQLFWEETSKIHEFAQNFGVHICHTVRLDILDRLTAAVLVQKTHSLENQNRFLNIIAVVAWERRDSFFNGFSRRGRFFGLWPWRTAADFQPRWTSMIGTTIMPF